jgi:NAD(P)-dependent dehydrogenase (short-subunit alcohol dehydrogenase family)
LLLSLKGKVAVVKGSTRGIDFAISKEFAENNDATVIVCSRRYGGKNIRAYTLALGNIATLATYYSMNENGRNKAAEEPSMKRWGRPEEVAKVAACIASDNFSFATGNTIVIDGGTVLL